MTDCSKNPVIMFSSAPLRTASIKSLNESIALRFAITLKPSFVRTRNCSVYPLNWPMSSFQTVVCPRGDDGIGKLAIGK